MTTMLRVLSCASAVPANMLATRPARMESFTVFMLAPLCFGGNSAGGPDHRLGHQRCETFGIGLHRHADILDARIVRRVLRPEIDQRLAIGFVVRNNHLTGPRLDDKEA